MCFSLYDDLIKIFKARRWTLGVAFGKLLALSLTIPTTGYCCWVVFHDRRTLLAVQVGRSSERLDLLKLIDFRRHLDRCLGSRSQVLVTAVTTISKVSTTSRPHVDRVSGAAP